MVIKNRLTEKKNENFVCHFCDYISSNAYDFKKHIMTQKHKKKAKKTTANGNKKSQSVENQCIFCENTYKHKSGLSRHKKNCKKNPKNLLKMATKVTQKSPKEESQKNEKLESLQTNSVLLEFVKQQKQQMELNNKTIELLKESIQTNNDMIPKIGNNNNNTISINVFLNENCKDAMNLTDFVQNIKVSLEDINFTTQNGFAKGITNIVTKQLEDLSPTERPMHCSNNEKLQFYVKDENKWEKDDDDQKFDNIISKMRLKQIQALGDWEKMHPNWKDNVEKYNHWQMVVTNIMGSPQDPEEFAKEREEIKRNLAKKVSMKDDNGNIIL